MFDRHGRAHDALGKFALMGHASVDRHPNGARSSAAFHPRASATERRGAKEIHVGQWASQVEIYDKRDRGEALTFRERQHISWQSPRKISEQQAKTGDAYVPRGEALQRFRSQAPRKSGKEWMGNRDAIVRNPRTGKLEARRATRHVELPSGAVVSAKRARRAFDLSRRPSRQPATAPQRTAAPKFTETELILSTNERLREMARSLGLTIPPRAGSRMLADLIREHQGRR